MFKKFAENTLLYGENLCNQNYNILQNVSEKIRNKKICFFSDFWGRWRAYGNYFFSQKLLPRSRSLFCSSGKNNTFTASQSPQVLNALLASNISSPACILFPFINSPS